MDLKDLAKALDTDNAVLIGSAVGATGLSIFAISMAAKRAKEGWDYKKPRVREIALGVMVTVGLIDLHLPEAIVEQASMEQLTDMLQLQYSRLAPEEMLPPRRDFMVVATEAKRIVYSIKRQDPRTI